MSQAIENVEEKLSADQEILVNLIKTNKWKPSENLDIRTLKTYSKQAEELLMAKGYQYPTKKNAPVIQQRVLAYI